MTDDSLAALDLARGDQRSAIHVGRYMLHRQIARGGMATIHIARLMGDEGFSRIVAAKRLLPEFAEDSEFVTMFLDEARIASRVHHRNVVPVLDVVNTGDEVVLVQEFVHGVPLHWLLNRARQTKAVVPVEISISIACQVLSGLHAAHETTDELGAPLNVVHRDVSPQNVMIASDGTARLLDFGVAKSLMAAHVTREGTYKGKLAYSAPEQLRGAAVRQSDIYSLTVLLWELLVGHRMHRSAQAEAELVATIMTGQLPKLTEAMAAQREWDAITDDHWHKIQALEPAIQRGLAVEPEHRFPTAQAMEEALISIVRPASNTAVAQWLKSLGKEYMDKHEKVLAAEEASWRKVAASNPGTNSFSGGPRRANPQTAPQRTGNTRLGSLPRPDDMLASGSMPKAIPTAPQARAPYALVALLSLLVVALAAGIIIIVRSPADPPASPPTAVAPPAAAPAPAPAPAAAPAPAPAPAAAPAPAPAAATAATGAAAAKPEEASQPPPSEVSIGEVETSSTPAPPPSRPSTARQTISRPVVRAPSRSSAPAVVAKPPPPEPAGSAPPPPEVKQPEVKQPEVKQPAKESCNPPYYFEGSKKIFKPACL
jgi:serine/threonine-protein kinase